MKSRASVLALALLASPAVAQTGATAPGEPQGAGPRGSSEPATGERRFDAVGYAAIGTGAGITVSAPGLRAGYAEVTAIDTGKTIIAIVGDEVPPPARVAVLSPAAASALGIVGDPAGLRVRPVNAPGPEIAALRAGQANARADAPPALIAALRRKLGPAPTQVAVAPRPKAPVAAKPVLRRPAPVVASTPAPVPPASAETLVPGFYVQYAALSSLEAASALSAKVGGVIERSDRVFRVHRGPFTSDADAKRERTRAASLGYRDAQTVRIIP